MKNAPHPLARPAGLPSTTDPAAPRHGRAPLLPYLPTNLRRHLLQAALAGPALPWWHGAWAQASASRVVELRGDVRRNGQALTAQGSVAAGDRIDTGPGASAVFTVGDSAYLVRENTRLELQGETPLTVRVLRLLSGAVASVWSKGADRQLVTPTLTAGIRGTGVYAEVWAQQDFRSYFCNCYGSVDLNAGGEQLRSESEYHQSFWAEAHPKEGRRLLPAEAINHTDEEMEMLAALVQQRTAWQITGRKGSRDGSGKQSPYGGYRTPQTRTPPAPQPAPEPHYSPN